METEKLTIGSRGSSLALWQSEKVKAEIQNAYPQLEIELKIIKTEGDLVLDKPLPMLGGKGVFTKEIEDRLITGEVDLAVHSFKDLPTELPQGLDIGGVLERSNPSDILVTGEGLDIDELPNGAMVATGSLRRSGQILHKRRDIQIIDIRGNVPTRLRKFEESDWDGMILARAGLERLGLLDPEWKELDFAIMLPAVAQGAIAIEIREDDDSLRNILEKISDTKTASAVTAERSLLKTLEGGCQVPVGAFAEVKGDALLLEAQVTDIDGTHAVRDRIEGEVSSAAELGEELAAKLLGFGADEILDRIRGGEEGINI